MIIYLSISSKHCIIMENLVSNFELKDVKQLLMCNISAVVLILLYFNGLLKYHKIQMNRAWFLYNWKNFSKTKQGIFILIKIK